MNVTVKNKLNNIFGLFTALDELIILCTAINTVPSHPIFKRNFGQVGACSLKN